MEVQSLSTSRPKWLLRWLAWPTERVGEHLVSQSADGSITFLLKDPDGPDLIFRLDPPSPSSDTPNEKGRSFASAG